MYYVENIKIFYEKLFLSQIMFEDVIDDFYIALNKLIIVIWGLPIKIMYKFKVLFFKDLNKGEYNV
jgi:hypothetical protein